MTEATSSLDVDSIRAQFPALSRKENGREVAYLDGPGGTQVPQRVIDAMSEALRLGVSNIGGDFGASQYAEELTAQGRQAMADFFNTDPGEVSFGQNMTKHHICGEPGPGPPVAARGRHRPHQSRS